MFFRSCFMDGMQFQVLRLHGISRKYCPSLEGRTGALYESYRPLISKCTLYVSLTRKSDIPGHPGLSLLPSISPCALQVGTRSTIMSTHISTAVATHTRMFAYGCARHCCSYCMAYGVARNNRRHGIHKCNAPLPQTAGLQYETKRGRREQPSRSSSSQYIPDAPTAVGSLMSNN